MNPHLTDALARLNERRGVHWGSKVQALTERDLAPKTRKAIDGLTEAFELELKDDGQVYLVKPGSAISADAATLNRAAFQLDTSGYVGGSPLHLSGRIYWRDITPLAQGYVEAMLRDADKVTGFQVRHVKFSDLAPETLARIIADCERNALSAAAMFKDRDKERIAGGGFWTTRQTGRIKAFPPLTPELRDGKVYLTGGAA